MSHNDGSEQISALIQAQERKLRALTSTVNEIEEALPLLQTMFAQAQRRVELLRKIITNTLQTAAQIQSEAVSIQDRAVRTERYAREVVDEVVQKGYRP